MGESHGLWKVKAVMVTNVVTVDVGVNVRKAVERMIPRQIWKKRLN